MVDDGELVLDDRNGDIQLNSVPKVAFQVRYALCHSHAAPASSTACMSHEPRIRLPLDARC